MARSTRSPQSSNRAIPDSLVWILGICFGVMVLITAVVTYLVVRDTAGAWAASGAPAGLPLADIFNPGPDNQEPGVVLTPFQPVTPTEQAAPVPTLPPNQALQSGDAEPPAVDWDGRSRINVLVLGIDERAWQTGDGPPRTDTMLLLTLDPETKTAGMLSLPRDLWVNIPGFNYGKINTAFPLGEAYQVQGVGPGLAMQTVELFLGVPVDHYVTVNFGAFIRIIDELGGVKVDVPEEITIDLLGDGASTLKTLQSGTQTLPGEWALAYARNRSTAGNDFDRAARQQQVIMGVFERIISFDILPTLLTRAHVIYTQLADGVQTNLTFDQIARLGWTVREVPLDSVNRAVIGAGQVTNDFSPEGLAILVPDLVAVRELRDQVFSNQPLINPSDPTASDQQRMTAEGATISVKNGSTAPGLAATTADFLINNGVNVTDVGNADAVYAETMLIDYTGNPATLAYMVQVLGLRPEQVVSSYDPDGLYDVLLLLGEDWAAENPLP